MPFGLPGDQRVDEIYAANYTSAPLDEPLEIIGMGKAVIHVSSTAPVMAFVARLSDVAPDGAIAAGHNWRAKRNCGATHSQTRSLWSRVRSMSCTWTWTLRHGGSSGGTGFGSPSAARTFRTCGRLPITARTGIYRDTECESYLELPVVPTREAPAGELPPDEMAYESSATPRTYPEASPRIVPWEITQDMMRDRTGLRLHLVNESRASADMTVRLESRLDVWANNRNPADTTAIGQHFRTITRTDSVINVDTSANVRSTQDAIHVSIDLDVRLNGLPHHQRRWAESFKRELL